MHTTLSSLPPQGGALGLPVVTASLSPGMNFQSSKVSVGKMPDNRAQRKESRPHWAHNVKAVALTQGWLRQAPASLSPVLCVGGAGTL